MSPRKKAPWRGFTLIEVLVAVTVFAVGLVSLGSLATMTLNGTAASRYRGMATTFASEKLEDLNRWPTWDPHVCVASGSTVGSLTSDVQAASVTCNGITDTVDYYDDVAISDSSRRGLRDGQQHKQRQPGLHINLPHAGRSHDNLDQRHGELDRRGRDCLPPSLDD